MPSVRELSVRLRYHMNTGPLARVNRQLDAHKRRMSTASRQTRGFNVQQARLERQYLSSMQAAEGLTGRLEVMNRQLGRQSDATQKATRNWRTMGAAVDQYRFQLAIATAASAGFIGLSVKRASDANETINAFTQTLGDNADAVRQWSEEFAAATRQNRFRVMETASQVAPLLDSIGLNAQESTELTQKLTQAAFDLSSIQNLPLSEAMAALRSGLAGQSEALLRYGVDVRQVALEQFNAEQGIVETEGALQGQEQALVRVQKILADFKKRGYWNDMSRTMHETANSARSINELFNEFLVNIGRRFEPVVGPMIDQLANLMNWMSKSPVVATATAVFAGLFTVLSGGALIFGTLATATIAWRSAIERLQGTRLGRTMMFWSRMMSGLSRAIFHPIQSMRSLWRTISPRRWARSQRAVQAYSATVRQSATAHRAAVSSSTGLMSLGTLWQRASLGVRSYVGGAWAAVRSSRAAAVAVRGLRIGLSMLGRATGVLIFFEVLMRGVNALLSRLGIMKDEMTGLSEEFRRPLDEAVREIGKVNRSIAEELQQLQSQFDQFEGPDLQGAEKIEAFIEDVRERRPDLLNEVLETGRTVEEALREQLGRQQVRETVGRHLGRDARGLSGFLSDLHDAIPVLNVLDDLMRSTFGQQKAELIDDLRRRQINLIDAFERLGEMGEAPGLDRFVQQFRARHDDLDMAGREAIVQFMHGLRSQRPQLFQENEDLLLELMEWYPQSPARRGPLRNLPEAGQQMIAQLQAGMIGNFPRLIGAMRSGLNQVARETDREMPRPRIPQPRVPSVGVPVFVDDRITAMLDELEARQRAIHVRTDTDRPEMPEVGDLQRRIRFEPVLDGFNETIAQLNGRVAFASVEVMPRLERFEAALQDVSRRRLMQEMDLPSRAMQAPFEAIGPGVGPAPAAVPAGGPTFNMPLNLHIGDINLGDVGDRDAREVGRQIGEQITQSSWEKFQEIEPHLANWMIRLYRGDTDKRPPDVKGRQP